jgi:hypothetical protein
MKHDLSQATIELPSNQSIALRPEDGARVAVLHGIVWLTRAGDQHDYVLRAGDSAPIARSGATLASAVADPASVMLLGQCIDQQAPTASGERYPSSAQLAYHRQRAHQLRAAYLNATLTRAGRKLARLFGQFCDSLRATPLGRDIE